MTPPKHRLEHSDDPLDLVVKGIFYVCVPLGFIVLCTALLGYCVHLVIS